MEINLTIDGNIIPVTVRKKDLENTSYSKVYSSMQKLLREEIKPEDLKDIMFQLLASNSIINFRIREILSREKYEKTMKDIVTEVYRDEITKEIKAIKKEIYNEV